LPLNQTPKPYVLFSRLPLSLSVNEAYCNNFRSGKGRFKSPQYKVYENAMRVWCLKNHQVIKQAKDYLKGQDFLSVKAIFYFPYERVLTKQHKPKRQDVTNRVKTLEDVLCKILEIDDCQFWKWSLEKRVGAEPQVELSIEIMEIPDAIA
jgi:Holliday junction resolvase RusA-like endonuclease